MPEYSGVAAVLPPAQIQSNAGQDLLNLAERFVAVKQAKQQQALSQVDSMVKMAGQGFPIDDKAFAKMVKQARLPIDLNPDALTAQIKVAKDAKAGVQGNQPDQKGGGQPPTAPPNPNMTPAEKQQTWINQMSTRARNIMNLNANTEEMKAQNSSQIESLKAKALAGDNNAAGQLIKLNQWDKGFSLDYAKWEGMSPEQKQKVLDMSAGMESDADKVNRGQRIGDAMLTSGKVSDPASAYQLGTILANGGMIPPGLQAKIKPFTFAEMGDQAKMMSSLVELGVPPNKLGQVVQSASHGGLENALPTGLKPIALQTLKLEQQRTGIELMRYEKEVEIAHRAALAEMRKDMTEQAKMDLDSFKNLVELKKAGASIDADLLKGASIKAAKALNMDVSEMPTFFNFLTGGTYLKFTPSLTSEGKSTVDKFSGKGNKTPKPSGFQSVMDAIIHPPKKEGV
jgi:hypothetical protein